MAIAFFLMLVVAEWFPPLSRSTQRTLSGLTWFLLVLAGTACRDILLLVITIPLLLASLAISAVLWRGTGSPRLRIAATLCYGIGVLSAAAAVIRFGAIAADLQCIRQMCHGQYTPAPPHPLRDMILWLPAPVVVAIGLKLSGRFDKAAIGVAAVALWLVDPAILMMVDGLQPW